jgi:hypothetical protein
MRTNAFIAVATVSLIVTYILVLRIETDMPRNMAEIIPETALVYVEQGEGMAALTKFAGSSFWQQVKSLDFSEITAEFPRHGKSLATLNNFVDFIKTAQDDPLLNELFGKRFALAVLPPPQKAPPSLTFADFLKENMVMVTTNENHKEFPEVLLSVSEQDGSRGNITSRQYGKHRVLRLTTVRKPLFLANLYGFSVLSYNERQLRRCIDTVDGETHAIARNDDFQAVTNNIGAVECFFYLPVANTREFLIPLFADNKNILKKLGATDGFSAFGYGRQNHVAGIKEKFVVRYQRANIETPAGNLLDILPIKGSMFSLTTPNPMLYHWSNSADVQRVFTSLVHAAESDSGLMNVVNRLETASGIDIKELLGLFGQESSVIFEAGNGNGPFSAPLGVIFVRVAEQAPLKAALQDLLTSFDIPMHQGQYGGAEYAYWSLSPQDGLCPLYGFWNDLFFFGNSTSLLHRVVDDESKALSLLDNARVQKIDPGIALENNSVTYCNNVQLIDTIKNILNIVGTFAAIEDRQLAKKFRLLTSKVINPLLDGAKMYTASVTRSYFTPELIVIESITNLSSPL